MNGPTPIISNMLKRTAERIPMRRWRGAVSAVMDEVGFIGSMRSPDCTLVRSIFRGPDKVRAFVYNSNRMNSGDIAWNQQQLSLLVQLLTSLLEAIKMPLQPLLVGNHQFASPLDLRF